MPAIARKTGQEHPTQRMEKNATCKTPSTASEKKAISPTAKHFRETGLGPISRGPAKQYRQVFWLGLKTATGLPVSRFPKVMRLSYKPAGAGETSNSGRTQSSPYSGASAAAFNRLPFSSVYATDTCTRWPLYGGAARLQEAATGKGRGIADDAVNADTAGDG